MPHRIRQQAAETGYAKGGMNPDTAILLQGPLGRLREAESVLRRSGIQSQVVRPPDSDPNA